MSGLATRASETFPTKLHIPLANCGPAPGFLGQQERIPAQISRGEGDAEQEGSGISEQGACELRDTRPLDLWRECFLLQRLTVSD